MERALESIIARANTAFIEARDNPGPDAKQIMAAASLEYDAAMRATAAFDRLGRIDPDRLGRLKTSARRKGAHPKHAAALALLETLGAVA